MPSKKSTKTKPGLAVKTAAVKAHLAKASRTHAAVAEAIHAKSQLAAKAAEAARWDQDRQDRLMKAVIAQQTEERARLEHQRVESEIAELTDALDAQQENAPPRADLQEPPYRDCHCGGALEPVGGDWRNTVPQTDPLYRDCHIEPKVEAPPSYSERSRESDTKAVLRGVLSRGALLYATRDSTLRGCCWAKRLRWKKVCDWFAGK